MITSICSEVSDTYLYMLDYLLVMKAKIMSLVLVALALFVFGCAQQVTPEVPDTEQAPEGDLEEVPEEWNVIRQYAIDNDKVSAEYFDEHYKYLRKETREVTGSGPHTYVIYQFNIVDTEGQTQSVEFEKALKGLEIVPPFFRGFPTKELGVVISKSEALEFAKQSGVCDSITDESDIHLFWKGKAETTEGTKYEFGFAWDWRGDDGRCFIDAETGAVEYEVYMQLLN